MISTWRNLANLYIGRIHQLKIMVKNDMKQIRSMLRIPLDNLNQDRIHTIKSMGGKILVVNSQEPCLTCGRHRRMQYTQRIDGKLFLVEECLYCTVRVKTAANRATA
jgi:hypothetical protein